MRNPFDPTFDQLPQTIPIFPLSGVLLLPRGKLPLNIFEPRYLAMTQDALASPDRMIGMIQPTQTGTTVYPVGCAGRITSFEETGDGRYLIALSGVCRFSIEQELPTTRGYRRVIPSWQPFHYDLDPEPDPAIDRDRLIEGLKCYFGLKGMSADWDSIGQAPCERLITLLAMICPFTSLEKQALLEAPDTTERARAMIAMIEMAIIENCDDNTPHACH